MAKSVLITGCSEGGIGDALTMEFHSKGARVFASARNPNKIKHLKAMGIETVALDVTVPESIEAAVATICRATGGTLDILVNNSGKGYSMPIVDSDLNVAKDMFLVNVFGMVALTQACASMIIAAKGKVINVGSIASRANVAWMGLYNASKAAATAISDAMRIELEPFDVQVVNVVAGTVNTRLFENQPQVELPKGSFYQPIGAEFTKSLAAEDVLSSSMDPRDFAAGVVDNALKKKSNAYYWRGGNATIVWLVSTFLPHTFPDSIFAKTGKLNLLRGRSHKGGAKPADK